MMFAQVSGREGEPEVVEGGFAVWAWDSGVNQRCKPGALHLSRAPVRRRIAVPRHSDSGLLPVLTCRFLLCRRRLGARAASAACTSRQAACKGRGCGRGMSGRTRVCPMQPCLSPREVLGKCLALAQGPQNRSEASAGDVIA